MLITLSNHKLTKPEQINRIVERVEYANPYCPI